MSIDIHQGGSGGPSLSSDIPVLRYKDATSHEVTKGEEESSEPMQGLVEVVLDSDDTR